MGGAAAQAGGARLRRRRNGGRWAWAAPGVTALVFAALLAGATGAPASVLGPLSMAGLRAFGLGAFARGFLLSKAHVPGTSPPLHPRPAPQYQKVVMFVLDAMRWDFVAEPLSAAPLPHEGAVGIFHEVAARRGPHAGLFQFEADPPTNTLQRLKALTGGSLPTFVDFSEAFAAEALPEDNLVAQLRAHGHSLYFVGDDTWEGLFPGLLGASHPFPSFNVQDLDTVDAGVEQHARRELARGSAGGWDVFVGHFLGVDHVGHTFHVRHPVMATKLRQMDDFFRWVVAELEAGAGPGGPFEDALLLVFGDHGQTLQGEHGGGGFDEAVSGLFAYAVQPAAQERGAGAGGGVGGVLPPTRLQQLDFAASLSAVLGMPTPFGNIGRLVPELWLLHSGCPTLESCGEPGVREGYRDALERNARQVHSYLHAYGGMDLGQLDALFADTERRAVEETSENLLGEHIVRLEAYLDSAAAVARGQWARFDPAAMFVGLVVLATVLLMEGKALVSWFGPRYTGELVIVGLLLALHGLAMLSNSYIMGEGLIIHYFFGTVALVYGRKCRSPSAMGALLVVLATNRAMLSFTARTHSESLTDIFNLNLLEDAPFPPALHAILQGCVCVAACRTALRRARDNGLRVALFYFLLGAQVILLCLYWAPRTSAQQWQDVSRSWALHLRLPRAVYALSAVGIVGVALQRRVSLGERGLRWVLCLLPTVALLHGERGLLCLAAGFVQSLALARLSREVSGTCSGERSPLILYMWSLSASQLFFSTGHLCQFAALKFNEAFIGFEEFDVVTQGVLLAMNTWSFHLLLALFALVLAGDKMHLPQTMRALIFPLAVNAFCASVCACLHRRHLMAYSIFAPKFVFSLAAVLVSDAFALLTGATAAGTKSIF